MKRAVVVLIVLAGRFCGLIIASAGEYKGEV